MDATDGLVRGMKVVDTGSPIMAPVGKAAIGRILNVVGQPVDGLGPIETDKRLPIHRPAPSFTDQNTDVELLETGIKVVDLLIPFPRAARSGLFGGAGVGQDRRADGNDQQHCQAAWRQLRIRRRRRTHQRRERPLS